MITQEKLNSWYEHKSNKELTIERMESAEDECEFCGGSGEVSTMEMVEAGNPGTMADVGSRPCPHCQNNEDEYEND